MPDPSVPRACDLLVTNAYLITLDQRRRVFIHGAVAVANGEILAVGRQEDLATKFVPHRTIDACGGPVLPGGYDCHAHTGLHSTRGAFSELGDESEYFKNYIDWTNALDSDDEYASTLLACLEMLKNGVTCFVEPGTAWDPDAVASAAEALGIRGSVADPYIWDVEDFWYASTITRAPANAARAHRDLGKQLYRNTNRSALVSGHVAIYGIGSATDELMLAAKQLADSNQTFFTMHQSFEPPDIAADDARLGRHPMVHFAEIGALGKNCLFLI